VLGHAAQMRGRRRSQALVAGGGQRGPLSAPVVRAGSSLDEPAGREAIHEPRGTRAGQEEAFRELAHPELTFVRSGELHENVVVGQRKALLRVQLALEPADDAIVPAQERDPRSNAGIVSADRLGHRSSAFGGQ